MRHILTYIRTITNHLTNIFRAALEAMEKRLDTQPEYRPDFITVKALMLVLQGKKEDAK